MKTEDFQKNFGMIWLKYTRDILGQNSWQKLIADLKNIFHQISIFIIHSRKPPNEPIPLTGPSY